MTDAEQTDVFLSAIKLQQLQQKHLFRVLTFTVTCQSFYWNLTRQTGTH